MAPKKSFYDLRLAEFKSQGFRSRFSKKANEWMMEEMAKLTIDSRKRLINDNALTKRDEPIVGKLCHYIYDPKHKETLPYYDRFPLALVVDILPDGFTALNLHYIDPMSRAKLFDHLLDFKTNKSYDKYTKIKMSYDLLKSASKFRAFKPCFKRYLFAHVQSRVAEIPADYWNIATFLPTQNFKKATAQRVWKESAKIAKI
jgi:hypothetical protein